MNKLDFLKKINSHFEGIKMQEILNESLVTGYHCLVQDSSLQTFSGGTSSNKETAKRIAIAEAFERSFLDLIYSNPILKNEYLLNEFPTSTGFAAGFHREQTRFRSLCEGLESWAWSKWIDNRYHIEKLEHPKNISSLAEGLLKNFKTFYWYKRKFEINVKDKILQLDFVVFLGCTDNGIFPGSRVSTQEDDLYEHPIIEAFRNLKNSELFQETNKKPSDIIQERVIFFSKNNNLALDQILRADKINWPQPEIRLLSEYDTGHPEIFLYRCLMKDFKGWHEGDVTRFVY